MSPLGSQSVNRRGFLATMTATTVAAGAFTLLARDASAVSALASMRVEPLRSGARAARHGADEAAHPVHGTRANAMRDQMTSSSAQDAATVVLVHGAFAESASWNSVIRQ